MTDLQPYSEHTTMKFKFSLLYVATVLLINWMFSVIPLITLPGGDKWSAGSILAGFVFIARDYAQREVGHKVILLMCLALVISYFTSSPFVALASGVAFLVSELIDYLTYSVSKLDFRSRVIVSSLISTPIDSVIFLAMIGHLTASSVIVMTLSKLIAVLVIWRSIK